MVDEKKESVWNKIWIPVVVSIITSIIAYNIWDIQYEKGKNDIIRSAKVELLEKLTTSLAKMNYLNSYRLRTTIYQARQVRHLLDSLKIKKLTPQQTVDVQYFLKEKSPLEYGKYLEALDYNSEVQGYLVSAQYYFNDSVKSKIRDYAYLLSDKGMSEVVVDLNQNNSIYNLDDNVAVHQIDSIMSERLSEIISGMINEIKSN